MSNVKRKLILLFFLLFSLAVISLYYSIGYGMYIEGNFVGVVHNHAEAEAITDILCAESQSTALNTTLFLRFLTHDGYTPAAELLKNAQAAGGIETEVITETLPIPYSVGTLEDDSLYLGEETVTTEGVDGRRIVVKEITKQNGILIREEILSETVSARPVSQIISVGTKPRPAGVGTGEFAFPLTEITVSSGFGLRWNRQHAGIDLAADTGDAILAADTGTVTFSGTCEGYGNLIIIDHQNGFTTYYAHCSVLYAAEGTMPEKGEVIAEVGSTGNSTGPHLHFEIRKDDTPINPLTFLPGMV
ncbi:MAG: hypothetical protein E7408_06170 [Ruminococcaceae bacterium]|nr:hypothetical protein [Oscillospiraceae bacterium]